MRRSLLYTYGVIGVISAVWVGVFSSLQPTQPVEVVLSFVVFFMAMTGAIATGSRVSAGKALHGNKFDERSGQLAHLFSTTKIAGEYRTYKQFVIASTATIVVGLVTRRAAPVVISAMALYTAQFFIFWRAAKRVPPSVLVLGSSSPTFGAEVHALRAALHPHRVIVLLDIPESSPRRDIDRLDNFRTTGEWHQLLHVLLEAAPVVVIDGRLGTSNLTYEAEAITRTTSKAVFVISADQTMGFIDSLGSKERAFYYQGKALRIEAAQLVAAVATGLDAAHMAAALP